jgi:hypothetical protein
MQPLCREAQVDREGIKVVHIATDLGHRMQLSHARVGRLLAGHVPPEVIRGIGIGGVERDSDLLISAED